ncbi:hypothetical protein C3L29_038805, partial [Pseudomonas sp. MWU12-2534b]
DLFDASTVQRFLDIYRTLLTGLADDASAAVARLPLMCDAERNRLTVEWNQTDMDFGEAAAQPLHRLFEQQVERTPDAVAAVFDDVSLTYAELNLRANRLADRLLAHGVPPHAPVGVATVRSPHIRVALLAHLQAGPPYLLHDAALPARPARVI